MAPFDMVLITNTASREFRFPLEVRDDDRVSYDTKPLPPTSPIFPQTAVGLSSHPPFSLIYGRGIEIQLTRWKHEAATGSNLRYWACSGTGGVARML